jgi:hypothetical protein
MSPKGFTLGVKAKVQLKSSNAIGAKVEMSPKGFTLGVKVEMEKIFSICPKGFTLGVKVEMEKIFSICPKLLINSELYEILAPRLKKGYPPIWEANLQPLGPMFQHLSIT